MGRITPAPEAARGRDGGVVVMTRTVAERAEGSLKDR